MKSKPGWVFIARDRQTGRVVTTTVPLYYRGRKQSYRKAARIALWKLNR